MNTQIVRKALWATLSFALWTAHAEAGDQALDNQVNNQSPSITNGLTYETFKPQIGLGKFLSEIDALNLTEAFLVQVQNLIDQYPEIGLPAADLKTQLQNILAAHRRGELDIPVWPVARPSTLQIMSGPEIQAFLKKSQTSQSASNISPMRMDLEKLIRLILTQEMCERVVDQPQVILKHPTTGEPILTMGHQANEGLDKLDGCYRQKSIWLAEALTRLAEGEATLNPVKLFGRTIRTATDLILLIAEQNSTIEVAIEKTLADFPSLNFNGKSVVFPVWLNVTSAAGGNYQVPMTHSQVTLLFNGPKLKTSVRFFLGVDGMKFYPNISRRPQWTGWNTQILAQTQNHSPADLNLIWQQADEGFLSPLNSLNTLRAELAELLKVLLVSRVAEAQVLRNRHEALGLYKNGYGFVGVCNDSVALIEAVVSSVLSKGAISRWSVAPTLRNIHLTKEPYPAAQILGEFNLVSGGLNADLKWLTRHIDWSEQGLYWQPEFTLEPKDSLQKATPDDLLKIHAMKAQTPGSLYDLSSVLSETMGRMESEARAKKAHTPCVNELFGVKTQILGSGPEN